MTACRIGRKKSSVRMAHVHISQQRSPFSFLRTYPLRYTEFSLRLARLTRTVRSRGIVMMYVTTTSLEVDQNDLGFMYRSAHRQISS